MLGAASQQQAFTLVLFTLSKHNSRVMCRFGSNLYKWGQRSNILYILMPSSSKKEKNWINFKLTVICRWISWIQWNWTLSAPLYHHVEALKETVHCILFFTMNSSEFKPRLEGPDRWCFPVKRRGSVSSELLVTQSLCLTDPLVLCSCWELSVTSSSLQVNSDTFISTWLMGVLLCSWSSYCESLKSLILIILVCPVF